MLEPILVARLPKGLSRLQYTVQKFFIESAEHYRSWPQQQFHAVVKAAQDELNARYMPQRLATALLPAIASFLETEDIVVQSSLYLRAARPNVASDVVGWHRESFYGAPKETANIWIPVMNVTPENTLRYVPGTEDLPDWDIETEQIEDASVPKGSDSHQIGLLYAPKHIVGGVALSQSKPMVVPEGSAVIFPGELVHGAAVNQSREIRFSVDMRVLAAAHKDRAKAGYFVPL